MCLYLILSIPNVKMYHKYFVAKPYIQFYIKFIIIHFIVIFGAYANDNFCLIEHESSQLSISN